MKNMLVVLFSCMAFLCHAQIQMASNKKWETIGHIKRVGTTIAKLEYRLEGRDTLYFLLMKDFTKREEPNYFSLNFNGVENTFHIFYQLLKSFFTDASKDDKNYMQTFKLGQTGVNLQHAPLIGQHGVRLTTGEGYINLSEKDIDRLFGKR